MGGRLWGVGAWVVAGLVVAAAGGARAGEPGPFVRVDGHIINMKYVVHIGFWGDTPHAQVFFKGGTNLVLTERETEQLVAALNLKAPAPASSSKRAGPDAPQGRRFLARDDFDGKPLLDWSAVRPDPSHVSYAKNPGALTITTQRGSIHGAETKDEFGEGVQAKNLYLIDNPLPAAADFVMITCVRGFHPETSYQQAGLIVYNDDDNYLKFTDEFDWTRGEGERFVVVTETAGEPEHAPVPPHPHSAWFWLRLTKRGNRYGYATSYDGTSFIRHGEVSWGNGPPKRLGLVAKNGGNKEAPEIDACFDFFEVRSPEDAPPGADAGPSEPKR